MKEIKLLLFSFYREKIGKDEISIPIEPHDTVEDLYFWLVKQYPKAIYPMEGLRFAVNGEYVDKNKKLNENDEVALVPPVAGG